MKGNTKPIAKLVSQFTMVAMETAASCWKSFDTINQPPGPSTKQLVIPNVKITMKHSRYCGYGNIIT